jgi:hypothetical protein
MDLRSEIIQRFGREKAHWLAHYIVQDEAYFAELIGYVLSDDEEESKYACWLISHCMHIDPAIVRPHLGPLIHHLAKPGLPEGTVRSIVKALAETDIPENLQGYALQYCFDLLLDPAQAVAIQVHAMQTVFNLSQNEPELLTELREVIEAGMEHGTAGYQSRGRKILKAISKNL